MPKRSQKSAARGPNDPERRLRIADAAIQVIAERGLERLTHRAVAQAAQIPLGSTTYYYATLDDLVLVAFERQFERDTIETKRWFENQPPHADIPAALAALLAEYVDSQRERILVVMDFYLAALHRPYLRHLSSEWSSLMTDLLAARMHRPAAAAMAAAFDGMLVWALISDTRFDQRFAEQSFRQIATSDRAAGDNGGQP